MAEKKQKRPVEAIAGLYSAIPHAVLNSVAFKGGCPMKAEALLSRLDKVKPTGSGRWVACCPAHNDRSPSLSIRELDDGRVLVHCFSGCEVEAVLGAVGLTFDALYPEKLTGNGKPRERHPFPATDILRALLHETLVVALAGYKIAKGEPLAPQYK